MCIRDRYRRDWSIERQLQNASGNRIPFQHGGHNDVRVNDCVILHLVSMSSGCGDFRIDLVERQICDSVFSGNAAGFLHGLKAPAFGFRFQLHAERDSVFLNQTGNTGAQIRRQVNSKLFTDAGGFDSGCVFCAELITHQDIMNGGTMVFKMGKKPSGWGK